jgi:membrane-bound lytic murein transglycosylase A
MYRITVLLIFAALAGCSNNEVIPSKTLSQKAGCDCVSTTKPPVATEPSPLVEPKPEPTKTVDYSLLKPAKWEDIETFTSDDMVRAWPAWLQGCSVLKNKPAWQNACAEAAKLTDQKKWSIISYFKQNFAVYSATNAEGLNTGLITGYYEPQLNGSRVKTSTYQFPIYSKPDDLITVELGSLYPELANKRVRGRLSGNKLIPYYPRAEIESDASPLQGKEMLWLDDLVDIFFLQIQGSGLMRLENGEQIQVGYADQNGQAYNSIGKILIERGELTADKASMQGIKAWAWNNPAKLRELLNANPSYVFFRELPADLPGPIGALGVPILPERVLAVDPKYIPLGAPVFLETTYPNMNKPLNRLMMAQDTGGAIKGGVRADFFWGVGEAAGKQAGAMKQTGKLWVLLPKEFILPSN